MFLEGGGYNSRAASKCGNTLRHISCRHFFDVWRHSFDVVQFICERGLYSEEGKLCVRTVALYFRYYFGK